MLVLKKTKLGETDLIITGFSEEGSQVRAVAKGARKSGSKLAVPLELYSVTRVLLHEGRGLGIIREVSIVESNASCRSDVIHSAGAAVIVELLEQISTEGNCEVRLFPMAREALRCLGSLPEEAVFLITAAAVLKIAAQLGFRPSMQECVLCGESMGAPLIPGDSSSGLCFSIGEGGLICSNCHGSLVDQPYIMLKPQISSWIETLLSSRFAELARCSGTDFTQAQCRSLGISLLTFANNWICFHMVRRLKSLDFLLSFD